MNFKMCLSFLNELLILRCSDSVVTTFLIKQIAKRSVRINSAELDEGTISEVNLLALRCCHRHQLELLHLEADLLVAQSFQIPQFVQGREILESHV